MTLTKAQSNAITVTDSTQGGIKGTTGTVTVAGSNKAFTATLEDAYGNVVTSSTDSTTFTLTYGTTADDSAISSSSIYTASTSTTSLQTVTVN